MTKPTTLEPKSGFSHLWWQARNPPHDPTTSFVGRTILITGANVGLGFEAATKFAALGATTLIFGVRSLDKGRVAKEEIEAKTRCKKDVIHILQLDMSDYNSIERFTEELIAKYPKLDTAVLNAGVAPSAYVLSKHGWEISLQVNVLSTAYLAILLLPHLRQASLTLGKPTLLEFVASNGHTGVKKEQVTGSSGILNKVNDKASFNFTAQYLISKLLEMWVVDQIAAKTSPSQVIIVSACPGLCKTNIGRDFSAVLRGADSLVKKLLARSSEEGSRTIVSATSIGAEDHGGFWTNDEISAPSALVTSEEGKQLGNQFWQETLDVLQKQNPQVEAILNGST